MQVAALFVRLGGTVIEALALVGLVAIGLGLSELVLALERRGARRRLYRRRAVSVLFVLAILAAILFLREEVGALTGPVVLLLSASLATAGWVLNLSESRWQAREQFTIKMIEKYLLDGEMDQNRLALSRRYPVGTEISFDDARRLHDEYRSMKVYQANKNGDRPIAYSLYYILNFWELLAQGVRYGQLEEQVLKQYFKATLLAVAKKTIHVIRIERGTTPIEVPGCTSSPAAFENLVWLAQRWQQIRIDAVPPRAQTANRSRSRR